MQWQERLPTQILDLARSYGLEAPDIAVVTRGDETHGVVEITVDDLIYRIGNQQRAALKALERLSEGGDDRVMPFVQRFGLLTGNFAAWLIGADLLVGGVEPSWPPVYHGKAGRHSERILIDECEDRSLLSRYMSYVRRLLKVATKAGAAGQKRFSAFRFVPEPAYFYRWAARHILALKEGRYEVSTWRFYQDRLSSLLLVPPFNALVNGVAETGSPLLVGALIDYLSLIAASDISAQDVSQPLQRICANPNCRIIFETWDGRVTYCPACQKSHVSDAVRAANYRRRERTKILNRAREVGD